MNSAQRAHQYNMDCAYREIAARNEAGEDTSDLAIDAQTYAIVKVKPRVSYPLRPGAFAEWDNPCPRRGF